MASVTSVTSVPSGIQGTLTSSYDKYQMIAFNLLTWVPVSKGQGLALEVTVITGIIEEQMILVETDHKDGRNSIATRCRKGNQVKASSERKYHLDVLLLDVENPIKDTTG